MLDFFTRLLTPLFISLNLINPTPEIIEQPVTPIVQEIKQEIQELELEKEVVIETRSVLITPKPIYKIPAIQKREIIEEDPIVVVETVIEELELEKNSDAECGDVVNGTILKNSYDEGILCKEGLLVNLVQESGEINYFCNGTEEGALNAKCSVFIEVDGECADIETGTVTSVSQYDSCNSGFLGEIKFKKISNNSSKYQGSYTWVCDGINGGISQSCFVEGKIISIPEWANCLKNNSCSYLSLSNCYGAC